MIRTYIEVNSDNIAVDWVTVHGPVDAPVPVIPHPDPASVEIGSFWTGTKWVPTEALVRKNRDQLLSTEVDAVAGNALRWGSLSTDKQTSWANYRTLLLDMPEQEGFPLSVVWPTKP